MNYITKINELLNPVGLNYSEITQIVSLQGLREKSIDPLVIDDCNKKLNLLIDQAKSRTIK